MNTSIDNRLNSPSLPISIPITAHDIDTKKTGDSLENNRKQLHLRIDAAAQPELQSCLDSVFNYLGDTLIRTQIDSVQKLTPVKYYLTEQGARLAAKAKIDADVYFAQLKIPSRRLIIKPETCSKLRWRGTLPWLKLNRMPP